MTNGDQQGYHTSPSDPEFREDATVRSAVDWRGNRFAVGEQVMYCIGAGRGQVMAIGEVLKIEAKRNQRNWFRDPEPGEEPNAFGWDYTTQTRTVPLVEVEHWYWSITVQVHTKITSGRWGNEERTRPAWPNPQNITALTGTGP